MIAQVPLPIGVGETRGFVQRGHCCLQRGHNRQWLTGGSIDDRAERRRTSLTEAFGSPLQPEPEEPEGVMMEAFSALVSTGCTPPISPEFSADAPRCFIGVLGIKHPVFPLYLDVQSVAVALCF